uniref:Phosphopantetheine adenylyltransferase n=1 Tax=Paulinella chromatophora TaxID=39717 RepID=B1X3S7_PAUCH|nr:coenzyme A biosynthesis protein [Paulinella chromatophora]ACB42596.1 coenzyme A biosynthesis protein [Paulinella chromatophora]
MRAIYPGTFDPFTMGHLDLVERSIQIFDEITIAIPSQSSKVTTFSLKTRLDQIRASTIHLGRVRVDAYTGLTVNYARQSNANVILRGIRASSDWEFELQVAHANRSLIQNIETFLLPTAPHYSFLSSSLVKEVARFGGDISKMVPITVEVDLSRVFNSLSMPR